MLNSYQAVRDHALQTLKFYYPQALDPKGGFYQNFYDNGEAFATGNKHLVSSCRMAFNFYQGHFHYGEPWMLEWAEHGFEAIFSQHLRDDDAGFIWTLEDGLAREVNQYCYGYAFVILACSAAYKAGTKHAYQRLMQTFDLLENEFWIADQRLYGDEISPDWETMSPYRGQNANMHACEAMLYAFETTEDTVFLEKAEQLADTVVGTLTDQGKRLIWEHYSEELQPDWEFNRDDPKNLYRPWGYQPGHQTEWTKLLLILNRFAPNAKWVGFAENLFDAALDTAWDTERGGIYYGFAPDGSICDDEKYFWVQAESMAAAAMLAEVTGKAAYWDWYAKLADYCWQNFVDHEHGAWYRLLTADNAKTSNRKSEAGAKCDYHNFNACLEVMQVLKRREV